MDPVTVGVGVVVALYGTSVVVDPHAFARERRDVGPDEDRSTFTWNWRVFGVLATAVGCYAVALGVGVV